MPSAPGQLEGSLNFSPPGLTPAQRSNLLPLTALGYPAWRERSLSLLTGGRLPLSQEARLFLALCGAGGGGRLDGQRWLDVGTSGGFYAGVLARAGAVVMAADLSPAMLRVARRREPHPGIDWALLNVERSGLPVASFDGVCVGATLNETASPPTLLAESARLLRPGGQLWLMYLARSGGAGQRLLSRLGGLTFPDPAELGDWLPGMERRHLSRRREVVFERWVRVEGVGRPGTAETGIL
ncbi:MAG: class I SAM-dependent methyltransferase [Deinococcus sp.]